MADDKKKKGEGGGGAAADKPAAAKPKLDEAEIAKKRAERAAKKAGKSAPTAHAAEDGVTHRRCYDRPLANGNTAPTGGSPVQDELRRPGFLPGRRLGAAGFRPTTVSVGPTGAARLRPPVRFFGPHLRANFALEFVGLS